MLSLLLPCVQQNHMCSQEVSRILSCNMLVSSDPFLIYSNIKAQFVVAEFIL